MRECGNAERPLTGGVQVRLRDFTRRRGAVRQGRPPALGPAEARSVGERSSYETLITLGSRMDMTGSLFVELDPECSAQRLRDPPRRRVKLRCSDA